jgi:hypothetical protein
MIVGTKDRGKIFANNSSPFISGILMSNVMTSGFNLAIKPSTSRGSPVSPTISTPVSFAKALCRIFRITAESSTISSRKARAGANITRPIEASRRISTRSRSRRARPVIVKLSLRNSRQTFS